MSQILLVKDLQNFVVVVVEKLELQRCRSDEKSLTTKCTKLQKEHAEEIDWAVKSNYPTCMDFRVEYFLQPPARLEIEVQATEYEFVVEEATG